MNWKPLSRERRAQLLTRATAGAPFADISAEMGISVRGLRWHWRDLASPEQKAARAAILRPRIVAGGRHGSEIAKQRAAQKPKPRRTVTKHRPKTGAINEAIDPWAGQGSVFA